MTSRKRERARTRKARAKKLPTARISNARLQAMIDEATVDCSDESEQVTGWYTMIEEHLAVPFEATILGVPATVERVVSLAKTLSRRLNPRNARSVMPIVRYAPMTIMWRLPRT